MNAQARLLAQLQAQDKRPDSGPNSYAEVLTADLREALTGADQTDPILSALTKGVNAPRLAAKIVCKTLDLYHVLNETG